MTDYLVVFQIQICQFLSELQTHPSSRITSQANSTSWPKWHINCLYFVSRELSEGKQDVLSKSQCRSHGEPGVDLAAGKGCFTVSKFEESRDNTMYCYHVILCWVFPKRSTRSMLWLGFSTLLFVTFQFEHPTHFSHSPRMCSRYCAEFRVVDLFTERGCIEGWLP